MTSAWATWLQTTAFSRLHKRSAGNIEYRKQEWQNLPVRKGDTFYSMANAITNSRKYIVGYISTEEGFGLTMIKPVIWTMNSDGTYGEYEDLPYPEKTSQALLLNIYCPTVYQKTVR